MSLHPDHFGKEWWKVMHQACAQGTTVEKRQHVIILITVIYPSLLPCASCREHFIQMLKKYNIKDYSSSAEQLFLLSYLLHDSVNIRLGKTSIPYETAKESVFPKEGSSMTCTTVCTETFEADYSEEHDDLDIPLFSSHSGRRTTTSEEKTSRRRNSSITRATSGSSAITQKVHSSHSTSSNNSSHSKASVSTKEKDSALFRHNIISRSNRSDAEKNKHDDDRVQESKTKTEFVRKIR